ncbi:MAG: TfoX/Sxy family protein [Aeoliella sp.]
MAYDERIAERLRKTYETVPNVVEKKMFGGIAFMVAGHMSCGVVDDKLMVRVGPERYEKALERSHARKMDFTGRPLKGFVFIAPAGFESAKALSSWIKLSLDFVDSLPPK